VSPRLSLSFLLCATVVAVGCSATRDEPDEPTSLGESELSATYSDGTDTYRYVDTHDEYRNTGVVDRSRFLYFRRVNGKRAVGLTQDCAWVEPDNAYEILDVLRRHDARITFFISGPFIFNSPRRGLAGGLVERNLPVIRRMIDEGHEFANHTQNHPHNNQSIDWVKENGNLAAGWSAVLARLYPGTSPPPNARMRNYWRAPYGEYDARSLGLASKAGFPFHFGWNVDVKDAVGFPSCSDEPQNARCLSAKKMTDTVLGFAERNAWSLDGFVVLSHLQNPYRWGRSPDGLERLLNTIAEKDHVVAKISEMFVEEPAPDPTPNGAAPRLGATCAEGCIYSGMCVAQNPGARKYYDAEGTELVCVKRGECAALCAVTGQ